MRRLWCLVLCLWAGSAFAQTDFFYWYDNSKGNVAVSRKGSATEVCQAASYSGGYSFAYLGTSPAGACGTFDARICVGGSNTTPQSYANFTTACKVKITCPPATELDMSTQPPSCVPIDQCKDKNPFVARFSYGSAVSTAGMPDHVGSCVIVPEELLKCYQDGLNKVCWWQVHRTGAVYSGSSPPSRPGGEQDSSGGDPSKPKTQTPPLLNDSPNNCPAGTVQGGFDSSGIPICYGTGSNPPPPPTQPKTTTSTPTTTSNPDGSTTTTQNTSVQNSDGSTTTTTTTTVVKADGSKEVTQSSSTTAGTSGSPGRYDGNPDDSKYDLCAKHPDLSICKNSSVSGSCEAISCTGDAIQCATLQQAALLQCHDKKREDDATASGAGQLGQAVLDGHDPAAATLPSPSKATEVGVPALDTAGWLGTGTGFKDKAFAVQGHTVVMPFAKLNDYVVVFRYVLQVIAGLVSARILWSAFSGA